MSRRRRTAERGASEGWGEATALRKRRMMMSRIKGGVEWRAFNFATRFSIKIQIIQMIEII